jgi:membrane fusion protein, multidrug efflux system
MKTDTTAVKESMEDVGPVEGKAKRTLFSGGRGGYLVLGGITAAFLLALGAWMLATRGHQTTDDAQVESEVVSIAARVGGSVRRVAVRENQAVKKGDLLVEIDDADLAARLEQARAELAGAEARALVAEASATGGLRSALASVTGSSDGVSQAQAQAEAAQAAVERASVAAAQAQADLARARELFAANAVSRDRLDNAQSAADGAAAGLVQAKAGLAAAQDARRVAVSRVEEAQGRLAQSSPTGAQIAAARAQARSAQAQARLAGLQLSYTRVTASADGVVSRLTVREGQIVAAGQSLGMLVPAGTYVLANFKETQIGGMREGDRVTVAVDAFPGRRLEGRVESLSGGTGARFSLLPPDNATGNFVKVVQRVPVRIAWAGTPDLPLQAGLSASVTVYTGHR